MAQRLAWYVAQSASRQFAAETLFGKVLDFRAVINDDSRNGYKTTHQWLFAGGQYLHPLIQGAEAGKRRIWWSAPPFWQGGNWDDAASGAYDGDWDAMLRGIVQVEAANGNTTGHIEFRPAFEFNGNWFHWSVGSKVNQFIQAWRRMWNVANAVAPGRFQFEYAPSETSQYTGSYADPNACWPGNQYVAKVGLDVYWKPFASWGQWGTNPDSAFNSALTSPLGLNWLKNFAAAKGNKPMVLSEWGVQGGQSTGSETINTEPYVRRTAEWCRANDVDMLYWNGTSTEGYLGDIVSHNNWPVTRQAVRVNFVNTADNSMTGGGTTNPTPTDPNPTPAPDTNSAVGALNTFNKESYDSRGLYPEPGNGYIRTWEGWAYWVLVAQGLKTGTVEAGQDTDPTVVATKIHTDMVAKRAEFTGDGLTQVDAWIALLAPWIDSAPPVEPEPEQPGTSPVLWVNDRTHPEDALYWINQTSLALRTATDLATVLATVRQIEATAYWAAVATGWRVDQSYTGTTYAVGDISQAQALQAEAEQQRDAVQAELASAEQQVASLTFDLEAARARIAALEAGGVPTAPLAVTRSADPMAFADSTLSYGFTAGGLVRMRLPEIRRAIFDELFTRTGQAFDETPDSLTGQFVSVFAEREAAIWELAEAVYLSSYPATASGVALDLAVSYAGVTRIQPTLSSVRATFSGAQGTLVEVGSIVESTYLPTGASSPPRYALTSDVLITREAANNVLLTIGGVVTGAVYSATYNGTLASTTAVGGDTQAAIATRLRAALAALGANATASSATIRILSASTFSIATSANVDISYLGSPGILAALEPGPVEAPALSLTKIATPKEGWTGVINGDAALPGTLLETDEDLRARYATGVYRLGAGTVPSIRANLLQDVPGIASAEVYENPTATTDADGRPPHSVEAVVEGGESALIAAVLYRTKPAGIRAYGTSTVPVQDETGFQHQIGFSRPAARPVWLRAVITTTTEETVPGDVAARAAAAMVEAGNALQVGEDVFLQRLAAAVFQATSGVARVELTAVVSTTTPAASAYVAADIPVGPRQRARFDLARTQVT